jgi:hypothetical protein
LQEVTTIHDKSEGLIFFNDICKAMVASLECIKKLLLYLLQLKKMTMGGGILKLLND